MKIETDLFVASSVFGVRFMEKLVITLTYQKTAENIVMPGNRT